MSDQCFNNFLNDCILRSLDSSDLIIEVLARRKKVGTENLFEISKEQINIFQTIFHDISNQIRSTVKIKNKSFDYEISKLRYHQQFGWTAEVENENFAENELKVFLGKMNIIEETKLTLGKRTYFSGGSLLRGGGFILVGAFTNIAENFKVYAYSDGHPMNYPAMMNLRHNSRIVADGLSMDLNYEGLDLKENSVIIGNDVWIGRDVSVKNGVHIGDGAVIGEKSLVKEDCVPYGVYAGTPATLKRYRFDPIIIEQLLEVKWWNWSLAKIMQNNVFFNTNLHRNKSKIRDLIL